MISRRAVRGCQRRPDPPLDQRDEIHGDNVPGVTMCVNIGMVIVIWSGGLQAIRGEMTVGQIVAFTNYLLTTMTR